MTEYVVVSRAKAKTPIARFPTIEGAGNYIVRERGHGRWRVLARDQGRPGEAMRELHAHEASTLEKKLYPSLFQ